MRKKYLLISLLFIAVGFAAVTTNLVINGTSIIKKNADNFKVYYSDALVNGNQDLSVVVDDTHLSFKTTLDTLGQIYVLDYDVTNSSKIYDAQLTMSCTGGNEYLTVVNSFDTVNNLLATDTRRGKLTLTLAKSYSGADMDVEIVCTLGANAVERNSEATGTPKDPVAVCKWEYEDLDDSGSLTVGDRYAKCEDAFYVTDVTEDNVELLTAQALTSEYRQAVPGETYADYVDFMSLNNIPSNGTWDGRRDLDIQTYSKDYIAPYVNGYVSYLRNLIGDNTITGDLMTYDKISKFNNGFFLLYDWLNLGEDTLWWTKTFVNVGYFNGYFVKDNMLYEGGINYLEYNDAMVRPVITISRDTLNRLTNTEPVLGAELFCENEGYKYGMLAPSTYYDGPTIGDSADAYFLCSDSEDFDDVYSFDIDGNPIDDFPSGEQGEDPGDPA